jgi:ABC-type lipoprotein export system ATPase subunit
VRANQISRVYRSGDTEVMALAGASFIIEQAETIAVLGPSGSGKSTLLHLIAGLGRPTAGYIEWPALGAPDALRPGPIAIAFQGPSLLPPLDVTENIELPLLLAGTDPGAARAAASRMIGRLQLEAIALKLPEELSGGQMQRVAIARALAGRPRLVLADEPTGQQDRDSAEGLMDVLLAEAEEHEASVVIATHDGSIAERCSARWSMNAGELAIEVAC